MRMLSFPGLLKFIALLSIVTLIGCESADVDPEHVAASGSGGGTSGGSSDGTPQGPGGETIKTIAVTPPSSVHTAVGDFSVLEVDPIAGYTFTWTVSNAALGTLSPSTGNKITYFTSSIPTTEPEIQTITVTGRNPGDTTVIYRGTSKITHRAP